MSAALPRLKQWEVQAGTLAATSPDWIYAGASLAMKLAALNEKHLPSGLLSCNKAIQGCGHSKGADAQVQWRRNVLGEA